MAGRNQHYLPQFAQRPFKTNETGNRAKVFRYQYEAPPQRSRRIMKTGADKFFYSDDTPTAQPNLDARITALENELSLIHQRLCSQTAGPVENSDEAIKLAQHLGMRTRALRDVLIDGISETISSFAETVARPGFFQDLLSAQRSSVETKIQTKIEDPAVIGSGMDIASPEAVSPILSYAIREALAPRLDQIGEALTEQFRPLFNISSEKAAAYHQDALSSAITNTKLPERLKALDWSVVVNDFGNGLILPDCATVTFDENNNATPGPFVMKGSQVCTILPLAPNRLLVGIAVGAKIPSNDRILSAIAECSQDFFVSPVKNASLDTLCQSIGLRGETIRDDIGRLGSEAVDPFRDRRSNTGRIGSREGRWDLTTHNYSTLNQEGLDEFASVMSRLLSLSLIHI